MTRIRYTNLDYCGQREYPTAQNAMTAAGAVSLDTYCTAVNTTTGSGHASTLANGVRHGQLKKIILAVDAGDLVLTVASLAGGNTITFDDAGDYALLMWDNVQWVLIEHSGVAISTV